MTNVAEDRCLTPKATAASLRDLLVANAVRLGRPDRFWVFWPDDDRANDDGDTRPPRTEGGQQ